MKNEYGPTLPISEEIHAMKYRSEGETFTEAMTRVAEALKDDEGHFNNFRTILYNQRFLPAGRVQSAMGAPRTVTPLEALIVNLVAHCPLWAYSMQSVKLLLLPVTEEALRWAFYL